MSVKKIVYRDGGRNDAGAWSVNLELPFFGNGADGFYERLRNALTERARDGGIGVFSYLTVTYCENDDVSLYIDVLYCRGRELIRLFRISDNRSGESCAEIKKGKKRDFVYRRGDRYFVCENSFGGQGTRGGYKRFLREIEVE